MKKILGIDSRIFWKYMWKNIWLGSTIGVLVGHVAYRFNDNDWVMFLLIYALLQGASIGGYLSYLVENCPQDKNDKK